MKNLFKINLVFFTLLFALVSCKDDDQNNGNMDPVTSQGPDIWVYGITVNNELTFFHAEDPTTFSFKTAITGVGEGEKLLSIDFRPATGELYALSNASKLYIINTSNFTARSVNTTAFTPAISGNIASIDFNPTVDRIRLVTNTGQNLRLHPETGVVAATDGNINGGNSPSIVGVAYTNSRAGASSTALFDIDMASGKLFKQDPPNDGTLVEVGSLNMMIMGQVAFDINPDNSVALIAAQTEDGNGLFTLNIETGKTMLINFLPDQIIDLAIPTDPVAYAVDNSNNLQIFNPNNPQPVSKAITGVQSGETILGIDFRPVNGQLYALGSSSRLYTINLSSGVAAAVGEPFGVAIEGTDFGFDFNPTVDRIRLVSNTGQNLRLHPETGAVAATDGNLNPGMPSVSGAAYTNNFAGTSSTTLFVVDHVTDRLYQQNPPNDGTLVETGALGIDINNANGFDIGSQSQKAYLIASVAGSTKIYTVNTANGSTTLLSNYPNAVNGFAVGLGF